MTKASRLADRHAAARGEAATQDNGGDRNGIHLHSLHRRGARHCEGAA